jgi:hypothetical protein
MSAHIPEFRRALMGRTHAQTWQPEAIEHSRRSWFHEAMTYLLFVLFLLALVGGAHLVAAVWG